MTIHKFSWDMPRLVRGGIRNATLVLLVSAILAAGVYTDLIFKTLDVVILQMVNALDLGNIYQAVVSNSHSKITMQSLPSMLAYGAGYCLLCLLTLYIYLGKRQQFLLVLLFYVGVFALCFCLLALGKLLGDFVPAYNLARRLIEMIVSPLPIILLVSAFSFAGKGMNGKQA
jgi:hypothetical protein